MDKQSYKEMLAETMSDLTGAEKEINRLQLLVAKYSDEENKIKNLVYNHSNNFELGKMIRLQFGPKGMFRE